MQIASSPPWREGTGLGQVAIGAVVVDIFTPFSLSESVSAARLGRVVATYRLRSMTHGPLQVEAP
jgi:hypothetical protein